MALREIVAFLGYKVDSRSEARVQNSLKGIRKLAVGLGAVFGARALVRGIKGTVAEVRDLGDEIDKTSKRLGVNAQALQELRFAAGLAGASAQDVTKGLRTLAKNALEAQQGTKSFVEDFEALGVSVTDARGALKPTEQLLLEVGEGLRGLSSDSQKLALAQTLLGRSGAQLIPLFDEGAEAIAAQRREARALGGVLEDDAIAAAVRLTDDTARLNFLMRGLKVVIGSEVIPVVLEFVRKLTRLGSTFRDDVKTGAEVLAVAFEIMAKAMLLTIRNLPTAIALLGALLVLASPLAAVITGVSAAVLLLIDDFETMGEGGTSVTGSLIREFEFLRDKTGSIFGAIGSMLVTAFKFWADQFLALFGTTLEKEIDAMFDRVQKRMELFQRFFSGIASFLGRTVDTVQEGLNRAGEGLGVLQTLPRAGGGVLASTPQLGSGSSSVINSSPRTNVEITVQANESASALDIARKSATEFKRELSDINRLAIRDLVPR